jgi:MoaA/NifB/PqqE/SkfB family radical SAM enzyme
MSKPLIYCSAPWNGLAVREDGVVRTCCAGSVPLGNLNQDSIGNILESDVVQQIKTAILDNTPHLNCFNCTHHPDSFSSLRNFYNTEFPDIDINSTRLKVLDIRWSNMCNLGCLYCGEQFSSTWADRLSGTVSTPVKTYQDDLLEWILKKFDEIDSIMLLGGEPMLMKQNQVLLSRMGDYPNININIVTNLSYDISRLPCLPALLAHPADKLQWVVSLENTGSKFEYIRNGANWAQVEKNLKFLVQHWPNSVSINFVYCLLSAFDIVETVKRLHGLGLKKFNLLSIIENPEINVFNMPAAVQSAARHQLDLVKQLHHDLIGSDHDLYPINGMDQIEKNFHHAVPNMSLAQFQSRIKWYDTWGQTSFDQLWPDLHSQVVQSLAE